MVKSDSAQSVSRVEACSVCALVSLFRFNQENYGDFLSFSREINDDEMCGKRITCSTSHSFDYILTPKYFPAMSCVRKHISAIIMRSSPN